MLVNSELFWCIVHPAVIALNVLSGLWVLSSAFGIFLKRLSTTLHAITFAIVDFITLFFVGSA